MLLLIWQLGICAVSYEQLIKASASSEAFPWRTFHRGTIQADFLNVYTMGLLGRDARSQNLNIYDSATQVRVLSQAVAPEPYPFDKPFYIYYPPSIFLADIPLTMFRIGPSWVVFWTTAMFLCSGSLWMLLRTVRFRRDEVLFVVVGFFSCFPTISSCESGQPSLWLLPVLLAIWLALTRRRFLVAGLATALYALKIQYLPAVVVAGLAFAGWRYLLGTGIGFFALVMACGLQLGWQNVLGFPRAISLEPSSAIAGVQVFMMQNFRGQIYMLRGRSPEDAFSSALVIGLYLTTLLFIAWLWYQARKHNWNEKQLQLCASITTMLMLLSSLHTHAHDFVLLAISSVWLWQFGRSWQPSKCRTALKWLLLVFPLFSWVMQWRFDITIAPLKTIVWELLNWSFPLLYSLGLWDYAQKLEGPLNVWLYWPVQLLAALEPYVVWLFLILLLVHRLVRSMAIFANPQVAVAVNASDELRGSSSS